MRTAILLTATALGFALFAVPTAQGWWHWGPDLNMRLHGSSFVTSSVDGRPTPTTGAFTTRQSGIVKGRFGRALITTQTVAEPAMPDGDCPATLPFGAELSTTFVLTFNDGSSLSASTGADASYCTDAVTFVADFGGAVAGGTGRFEGATGTWSSEAQILNSIMTGHLSIDLD